MFYLTTIFIIRKVRLFLLVTFKLFCSKKLCNIFQKNISALAYSSKFCFYQKQIKNKMLNLENYIYFTIKETYGV